MFDSIQSQVEQALRNVKNDNHGIDRVIHMPNPALNSWPIDKPFPGPINLEVTIDPYGNIKSIYSC